MNERLKELMLEAGYAAPELAERAQKLAELIVQECAKFVDDNLSYDDSNNTFCPEPEDLLQHFGIKDD